MLYTHPTARMGNQLDKDKSEIRLGVRVRKIEGELVKRASFLRE